MAKWWPFGRKGKEDRERAPRPAPTPRPAPEPRGEPEPKPKRGVLGRLFGRGKKKPPPEAPPAPAPEPGPAPAGEAEPPSGGPPASGPPEGPPGGPEPVYPGSLYVSATGTWRISSTTWYGTMHGNLSGADVADFIRAMDRGDQGQAVGLVAMAYDDGSGIGDLLDVEASSIDHISY